MVESIRNPSAAGSVDVHVGARIRLRRTLLGLSQEKLGAALGLTFQQVQKYERGANKVGASRLYELSKILDVPIGFFFDDMSSLNVPSSNVTTVGFAEAPASFDADERLEPSKSTDEALLFSRKETVELVRAYYNLPDSSVRRRVFELIKSLVEIKKAR